MTKPETHGYVEVDLVTWIELGGRRCSWQAGSAPMWELLEIINDPNGYVVKPEKDGSITIREISQVSPGDRIK